MISALTRLYTTDLGTSGGDGRLPPSGGNPPLNRDNFGLAVNTLGMTILTRKPDGSPAHSFSRAESFQRLLINVSAHKQPCRPHAPR